VVRIGDNTAIGNIAKATTQGVKPETLMKLEIERFVKIITYIAVTIGIVFFIVAVAASGYDVLEALIFTIGIIVANVPEGLLATVTVALTITAQRMASKNVLVKTVETVETLGSVTVIASDKTGTLTQNRMTVRHAICNSLPADVSDLVHTNISEHLGTTTWIPTIHPVSYTGKTLDDNQEFENLVECAGLCLHAQFIEHDKPILQRATNGDASESALLKFAHCHSMAADLAAKFPEVACVPFNSANKWMATIHKDPAGGYRLIVKGAPERVLSKCAFHGNHIPLTAAVRHSSMSNIHFAILN
jgi:sodium/potassium-transporting ATPase subunit alpha